MARVFRLPDIGEGIAEAELLQWYVQEGDVLKEGQNIAEIETDKAVVDLPSPFAGTVLHLHFKPGDQIPVGSAFISFAEGEEQAAEPPAQGPALQASATRPQEPGMGRVLAAPATRRHARELGVDLAAVQGTGPGGRITLADVEQYTHPARQALAVAPRDALSPPQPAPLHTPLPDFAQWGPVERVALSATRKQIARKMAHSLLRVPHAAALDEVDVSELEVFRQRAREHVKDRGIHLTLLPFVMKAVVAGLKRCPALNASLDEEKQELILKHHYHLGVAVDTERGLIVPVIREVARKSILELAAELDDLVARTRAGKVTLSELRGGTFTLTNAGAVGGSTFIPLINYPEVAILGIGRAQAKPVVREGQIVVRTMLPLSLSFDHRVVDGADVIRFLQVVMQLLEDPIRLLVES
ncbi:MAG: 2-oxo acid dehydrogenase subunit E2 [Nitrospinae bacterium]|nr:2-oxo acid dehydrogenase subunit E2 [Nitrospinota bacterium]